MENKTQASQALDRLNAAFNIDPHRYAFGWSEKPYLMFCHGCGSLHVVNSAFISSPLAFGVTFEDKSSLSVPCHGCKKCMADPAKPIRQAWEHGMTSEVRARGEAALKGAVSA